MITFEITHTSYFIIYLTQKMKLQKNICKRIFEFGKSLLIRNFMTYIFFENLTVKVEDTEKSLGNAICHQSSFRIFFNES